MDKCVFCRVVKGELPATKEYEDEGILVICDIKPAAPVHVLIIPKAHFTSLEVIDDQFLSRLFKVASKMAGRLGIEDSYRLVINKGKWVQEVPHFHIHLLGGWSSAGAVNRQV